MLCARLRTYRSIIMQSCTAKNEALSSARTNLPESGPELSFFPEKKMQHFRSITGAVEGVMLPPRVVRIDDEGRAAPAR